ncbi:MAG: calcium-binding protein [Nostoc sp. SerVER01]|nr:calcium-binding protein [Nostoc sp. SerVER01]
MPGGTNGPDNLVGVFDFPFFGIDLPDIINGFGGNDSLTGLGTNDTLNGGNGNDTLNGGGGADRLDGGDNDDLYIVDNVGDIATEVFGDALGGVDTVQASVSYTLSANLENLTLTGFGSINGTGNARGNVIIGNSGNNSLSGLGGNDTIFGGNGNDTVNGGTGADRLDGGDNDDLYIVDNVGDIATEVFGDALGGVDTVQASVSYTLSANLENLTLTGFAANGTGNARGNIINGNGLSNILSGLAGNDTINGGGGNDTINGGTGNDTINGGTDNDRITGGGGTDVLTGGLGNDVFNYDSISESLPGLLRDTINDFVGNGFGLGDQIDLSDIDANPFVAGNQAFSFIGAAAFTAVGQVSYIGGILRANTDFVFGFESEFDIQLAGAPAPALFVAAGNPGSDIIL